MNNSAPWDTLRDFEDPYTFSPNERVGHVFLYSFVTALTSNLTVIALLRHRHIRTRTNIFILNLALADLVFAAVSQPINIIQILLKHWPLLPLPPFPSPPTGQRSHAALNMTIIIVDRYYSHLPPHRTVIRSRSFKFCYPLALILCFLLPVPLISHRKVAVFEPVEDFKRYQLCLPNRGKGGIVLSAIVTVIQMGAPIFSAAATLRIHPTAYPSPSPSHSTIYSAHKWLHRRNALGVTLQRRNTCAVQNENIRLAKERKAKSLSRTRTYLLSMVALFVISWIPLYFLHFSGIPDQSVKLSDSHFALLMVCYEASLLSAIFNPLFNMKLNSNVVREFAGIFDRAPNRIIY